MSTALSFDNLQEATPLMQSLRDLSEFVGATSTTGRIECRTGRFTALTNALTDADQIASTASSLLTRSYGQGSHSDQLHIRVSIAFDPVTLGTAEPIMERVIADLEALVITQLGLQSTNNNPGVKAALEKVVANLGAPDRLFSARAHTTVAGLSTTIGEDELNQFLLVNKDTHEFVSIYVRPGHIKKGRIVPP